MPYAGIWPKIHETAFIAPGVAIIGDVTIGEGSSVWFNSVIRGDVMPIKIGNFTNIQDGSVIHVTRKIGPTNIGNHVTIGHKCLLHACNLEDETFVGMGAILLDDAKLEKHSMLAAGALLTSGKTIPSGEIWAGNPAKFFRQMSENEKNHIMVSSKNYYQHCLEYRG